MTSGMHSGVGFADLLPPQELCNDRMVVRQAAQTSLSKQVGPTVADMRQRETLSAKEQADERGPHPG